MKLKIPEKVKKKARLALKLKRRGWKGMLQTGMKRARQLAYDDTIDIEDAITMSAWFARHQYTSKPGYDKWALDDKPMDKSQKNKRQRCCFVVRMGWKCWL